METERIKKHCIYCGKEVWVIKYIDKFGEENIDVAICETCSEEYFETWSYDEFRELPEDEKNMIFLNANHVKFLIAKFQQDIKKLFITALKLIINTIKLIKNRIK